MRGRYQQQTRIGWSCDDAQAAAKQADCTNGGGTHSASGNACGCVTDETIYPLGVEEMTISFRHTFDVHIARAYYTRHALPLCSAFCTHCWPPITYTRVGILLHELPLHLTLPL